MESILTSIKKMLGLSEKYEQFDTDIIIHINSVFMTLTQLGVGPSEGFFIEDATSEWTDFVEDIAKINAVKTYMFLKLKILFDPGSIGSSTLAAYERQIQELEWRLHVLCDTTGGGSTGGSSGGNTGNTGNASCDCADDVAVLSDRIGEVDDALDAITKIQDALIDKGDAT